MRWSVGYFSQMEWSLWAAQHTNGNEWKSIRNSHSQTNKSFHIIPGHFPFPIFFCCEGIWSTQHRKLLHKFSVGSFNALSIFFLTVTFCRFSMFAFFDCNVSNRLFRKAISMPIVALFISILPIVLLLKHTLFSIAYICLYSLYPVELTAIFGFPSKFAHFHPNNCLTKSANTTIITRTATTATITKNMCTYRGAFIYSQMCSIYNMFWAFLIKTASIYAKFVSIYTWKKSYIREWLRIRLLQNAIAHTYAIRSHPQVFEEFARIRWCS